MARAPSDFFKVLPTSLPPAQPYYYLSDRQRRFCEKSSILAPYAKHLPGWVPHRHVADALGHSQSGIEAVLPMPMLNGRPYVWATEFENVHSFWKFSEQRLEVDGVMYHCSEDFFHKQKPKPFDSKVWNGLGPGLGLRDQVMDIAVRRKFQNAELRQLLVATYPHPLLSIKGDSYWGVLPSGRGENRLAVLLESLRMELVAETPNGSSGCTDAETDAKDDVTDGMPDDTGATSANNELPWTAEEEHPPAP
eukprot:TRINITY_DN101503_c0_g1_i1.p1 TRINITY_DN101503_c0_g1~~TRINITY_DN101503_c0_g1_i1.p1  ORF type:complete len:250 (+),score=24.17 TRINITY_DN101503_c0_g1_i1:69-818(+)